MPSFLTSAPLASKPPDLEIYTDVAIPLKESGRYQYHARYKHGLDVRTAGSICPQTLAHGCHGFIVLPYSELYVVFKGQIR